MYKYFKLSEFDSPDRPGTGELMEHDVLEALDVARDIAGFPFIVTSGVRTVEYNRELMKKGYPVSPKSSHLLGWAADLKVVSTRKRFLMMEALLDAGFNRFGIGKDYIHVDMDPNKDPNVIWTY
jgi:zinc D-Ala-D-Ala carboxypeptidase